MVRMIKIITWSLILMVTTPMSILADELAAKSVVLECKGGLSYCGGDNGTTKRCDVPDSTVYVIEWRGASIKHIDMYGTLAFTDKCYTTSSVVQCSEEAEGMTMSNYGHTSRMLILDRATGSVDLTMVQENSEKNTMRTKLGFSQTIVKYKGACLPRANKTLF